jgi:hypothetical protein
MQKRILIIALLLTVAGCSAGTYLQRVYSYDSYTELPNKAMAVALNSYSSFEPSTDLCVSCGYGISGGNTLSQARSGALKNCMRSNPKSICVLEQENNNYVFPQRLAAFRNQLQQNYIASIKTKCKSYGFVTEGSIAVCVQQEIQKNEQLSFQRNQQIAQQNQINAQNRARAFSEIGDLGKTILGGGQPKPNTQLIGPSPTRGMYKTCTYRVGSQLLPITVNSMSFCQPTVNFNGITGILVR